MAYGDNRTVISSDPFDSSIGGDWENGPDLWPVLGWLTGGYVADVNQTQGVIINTGNSFTDNQWSQVVVQEHSGVANIGASIMGGSGLTRCYIGYNDADTPLYEILDIAEGGTSSSVASAASSGAMSSGDTLTLEGVDGDIRLGTDEGSGDTERIGDADATWSDGVVGVYLYDAAGVDKADITSWSGGNIGETFDADGQIVLPALTTNGVALITQIASGTPTLASLTINGIASTPYNADGQLILPSISITGVASGVLSYDADGQVTLPFLTIDGVALATHIADGQPTLPVISIGGLADITYTGDSQVVLPSLSISGTAQTVYTADGQIILPALVADGLAEIAYLAAGQPSLPSLTINGVAALALDGIGDVTFSNIVISGDSNLEYSGIGTPVLGGIEISGMANIEYFAVGAFNLPAIDITGVAGAAISGDAIGDVQLPMIDFNGVVFPTHIAIGDIFLPTILIGSNVTATSFSKSFTANFTVPFTTY